ncbi:MAG: hypothetical protein ACLFTS_01770 [Candidatus Paceibacterota bacterium]
MEDSKNIRSGFFKMKKLVFLHVLFLIILPAFVVVLTKPAPVKAQAIPFGGMVQSAIYCNCSFNWLLEIGPPVSATLIYSPYSSFQYPNYSLPRTGVWALGLYNPGGVCLMISYPSCTTYGSPQGTINFVGTSM